MKNIKYIALDIDGVLLRDTFSPVIRNLVNKSGGEYNAFVERNVFSQSRQSAAKFLIDYLKLKISTDELIEIYFKERESHLKNFNSLHNNGIKNFLDTIKNLNVEILSYGGLPEEHFIKELKDYKSYFKEYICTNDFRPGLKKITFDIYKLSPYQILFIDDVNKVAEEAKKLSIPFIGIPSTLYQKQDMEKTGVQYLFNSIADITKEYLLEIDKKSGLNTIWK